MALPRKPKVSTLETEAVTEPAAPKPIKLLATGWNLLEPHDQIWFVSGKPREVYHLTKWMQAQIGAGLLKVV
jgi:hypothetical protein